jgi:hypothetical protein
MVTTVLEMVKVIKVILFLCLIKHDVMKTYGGVKLQLHLNISSNWRRVFTFRAQPQTVKTSSVECVN